MSPRLLDRLLLILILLKYAQFPIVQIILTRVGQVIHVRRCCIAKIPRWGTGVEPSVSQEKLAVCGMKHSYVSHIGPLVMGQPDLTIHHMVRVYLGGRFDYRTPLSMGRPDP